MERLVIYPKDIQMITGKSYRQAVRILNHLKRILHKEQHQYITFEEFYTHYGIAPKNINNKLSPNPFVDKA